MSSKKQLAEDDDVFVLDFNFWWHGRSNSNALGATVGSVMRLQEWLVQVKECPKSFSYYWV